MVEQGVLKIGGCTKHGITNDEVGSRWKRAQEIIEDAVSSYQEGEESDSEWYAQWKGVHDCNCCLGPCKRPAILCNQCMSKLAGQLSTCPACDTAIPPDRVPQFCLVCGWQQEDKTSWP